MKTETSKDAETTELSRDQLDLVAGGIHFYVPKLQTPPVSWQAVVDAEFTLPNVGF
jgi:hypothetical protein